MGVTEKEILIAVIGALGGIIAALALVHKNAADTRAKEKETDNQAGKLALELANTLKEQLDTLEEKAGKCSKEIEAVKELARKKDNRIIELEKQTAAQAAQIEDQAKEIMILKKLGEEKTKIIKELTARLDAVEYATGNGAIE